MRDIRQMEWDFGFEDARLTTSANRMSRRRSGRWWRGDEVDGVADGWRRGGRNR